MLAAVYADHGMVSEVCLEICGRRGDLCKHHLVGHAMHTEGLIDATCNFRHAGLKRKRCRWVDASTNKRDPPPLCGSTASIKPRPGV